MEAFANKGVASAGIEEITRAAGYSRGAFYANYGSKLELLVDALEQKQVGALRLWRGVIDGAGDPAQSLAALSKIFDDPASRQEGLLALELQLEADRNPAFQPLYVAYLDSLYDEMRRLLVTMLARHGRAPPANLDALLVATRLLSLSVGSSSVLGTEIGARLRPGAIVLDFLNNLIASAPLLAADGEA
jgi:AcrR family transcriptional regulator